MLNPRLPVLLAVASVVALTFAAPSYSVGTSSSRATDSPPANLSPPTISGTAAVGSTLQGSTGTWSGMPTTFTYFWYRGYDLCCLGELGSSTSIVVPVDASYEHIWLMVRATNAAGSTDAWSDATPSIPGGVFSAVTAVENPCTSVNVSFGWSAPYPASFKVTSAPDGITATGSSSPITVTGLTTGT